MITGDFLDATLGYLGRMTAVSVVLVGYYFLFFRNRSFHRWNRGYLLGSVLVSLLMPLIPLPGPISWSGDGQVMQGVFHAVVHGNWNEEQAAGAGAVMGVTADRDGSSWIGWLYLLIASAAAFLFLKELRSILRLYRRYPRERRGKIMFLLTREPGTPFSFWKTIFWNAELDMECAEGRQMLRHEMVHVRRLHTADLFFLRVVQIVFWMNPVFYWVYLELRTLHEFEADALAVDAEDRYAYAELLVWQTIGARPGGLVHRFFSSSIKRRINMITKHSIVVPARASRFLVAPVAGLLFCAYHAKPEAGVAVASVTAEKSIVVKSATSGERPGAAKRAIVVTGGTNGEKRADPVTAAGRTLTVVIDAGHGGWDDGAVAPNGLREKDVNLAIARKVKELASGYGVKVVLTRDADVLSGGTMSRQASLHYRSRLAAEKKADLFISLHTDAGSGANQQGFHVYVSKENAHFGQSTRLGGFLIDALRPSYTVGEELLENQEHVWVLRAATVPAIMVLCGNIDNERDRAFISNASNQETVARDILEAIVQYHK